MNLTWPLWAVTLRFRIRTNVPEKIKLASSTHTHTHTRRRGLGPTFLPSEGPDSGHLMKSTMWEEKQDLKFCELRPPSGWYSTKSKDSQNLCCSAISPWPLNQRTHFTTNNARAISTYLLPTKLIPHLACECWSSFQVHPTRRVDNFLQLFV